MMLLEDAATLWFRHLSRTRTANEVERVLRAQLFPHLTGMRLDAVRKRDLIAAIDCAALRGQSNAHHLLSYSRRFFNWCCARDLLDHSPCDRLSGRLIIGPHVIRQRVLDARELSAIWRACARAGRFGTLVQLILVTGQRRSEVGGMRWAELSALESEGEALWTIPAARYKSGVTHRLPLSALAVRLLRGLERSGESALVFPASTGTGPLSGFSKAKARLDRACGVEGWTLHDLRRTMRTRMAALGVRDEIAEACLGHGKRGLARVYNQFRDEAAMREAFERWAQSLGRDVRVRRAATGNELQAIRHAHSR
jgi:integrase